MLAGATNVRQQLAAANKTGVTVTASGSINTMGSYAQIASALSSDCDGIYIVFTASNVSGVVRNMVCDIGVDPAGGTSYSAVITGILAGQANVRSAGGLAFYFPIAIKAGSTVAVRCQCSTASQTVLVYSQFYGQPSRPELGRAASYCETLGTITSSVGTTFNPGGLTSSKSAWASVGTTTLDHWFVQLSMAINNATVNATTAYFDVGYGDGSSNMTIVLSDAAFAFTTNETATHPVDIMGHCYIPAGATVYVRAALSGGSDTSGKNVMVHCFGG